MKAFIQENLDVLGVNAVTLSISLTEVEQFLQIVGLLIGIIYTIDKYIHHRKTRDVK